MKPDKKWLALLTTGLLVLGLILVSTGSALAARDQGDIQPELTQFDLQGALAAKAPVPDHPLLETWTVNGQDFIVTSAPTEPPADGSATASGATVCMDPAGAEIACADVAVNDLISVSGDIVHAFGTPGTWYAATVKVLAEPTEGEATYTYTGVLTEIHENSAVIGEFFFVGDDTSIAPDFFGLGDLVLVTFKILDDGSFWALSGEVLEQADPYTHSGTLDAIADNGDGTAIWTIGGTDFMINSETSLPAEYAVGDEVKVSFLVQAGANLALSVELVSAHVPPSIPPMEELCTTGLDGHPELLAKAQAMGIPDPAALLDYFCGGMSLDEIAMAVQLAAGSSYAPEELLEMRLSGMSWDEIKALLGGQPHEGSEDNDPSDEDDSHTGEWLRRAIKTFNLPFPGQFSDPGNSDDSDHSDQNSGDSDPDDHTNDGECPDG